MKLSNVTRDKNNVINHICQDEKLIYHLGRILPAEPSHIGKKIKATRERKGLSLKEVGELANGMSHTTLSKIENGVNNPSRRTLAVLAKVLNDNFGDESLNEFLTGNNQIPTKKEIVKDMTVKEFVSLKFDGKNTRRSQQEIDMLTKLLDAELERVETETND